MTSAPSQEAGSTPTGETAPVPPRAPWWSIVIGALWLAVPTALLLTDFPALRAGHPAHLIVRRAHELAPTLTEGPEARRAPLVVAGHGPGARAVATSCDPLPLPPLPRDAVRRATAQGRAAREQVMAMIALGANVRAGPTVTPEQALDRAGLALPESNKPVATYVMSGRGAMAGELPTRDHAAGCDGSSSE